MKTERYIELFVNRRDAYALQTKSGRYHLRKEEVTMDVVEEHLLGQITCGWYCINQEGQMKWACLDADTEDGIRNLQAVNKRLSALHIPSYIEESRDGRGHLWIFTEPMSPKPVRRLLRAVVEVEVEIFPKQDHISVRGYGSLVRGPLGVHQRTGGRYGFLDPESLDKVGSNLTAQLEYLETVQIASGITIAEALVEVLDGPRERREPPPPRLEVDVVTMAERFTQLERKGHYYVGLCPLHPEAHHSFAVYPNQGRRGRWFCFHEYRGGDAISLYAEMKGLSYRQAWEELRQQEGEGIVRGRVSFKR